MLKNRKLQVAGLALCTSVVAYASPWDIDMVDAVFMRGYEWRMMKTPEGAVSMDNTYSMTEKGYRPFKLASKDASTGWGADPIELVMKSTPGMDGNWLTELKESQLRAEAFYTRKGKINQDSKSMLEVGEKMFKVYCQTCHGVGGNGNAPLTWTEKEDSNGNAIQVKRWTDVPNLAGVTTKNDAYMYLIIRNGREKMPAYGHAMYDEEIWAAIAYMRADTITNDDGTVSGGLGYKYVEIK